MTLEISEALLGKPSDSPEVEALLHTLGAKPPRRKKGDVDAWVVANDYGVELVFSDQAHFEGREDLAVGEGALLLTGVHFRSADYPDSSAFTGQLPLPIDFGFSKVRVHSALGEPEWVSPILPSERWTIDGVQYLIRYKDDDDEILVLTMFIPQ